MKIMPLSTRRSSTRGLPWLLGKKGFRRAAGRNSAWPSRALMNRPGLVPADEPTGNLDRVSAMQVMDLIGEINRDEGTNFRISTHDEKIAGLCRRQIVVGDGMVTG